MPLEPLGDLEWRHPGGVWQRPVLRRRPVSHGVCRPRPPCGKSGASGRGGGICCSAGARRRRGRRPPRAAGRNCLRPGFHRLLQGYADALLASKPAALAGPEDRGTPLLHRAARRAAHRPAADVLLQAVALGALPLPVLVKLFVSLLLRPSPTALAGRRRAAALPSLPGGCRLAGAGLPAAALSCAGSRGGPPTAAAVRGRLGRWRRPGGGLLRLSLCLSCSASLLLAAAFGVATSACRRPAAPAAALLPAMLHDLEALYAREAKPLGRRLLATPGGLRSGTF
mmetsp:Transcript_1729/g.4663  ORF Transcript_1729/g.4663 Transcript_1729/m.4663 type:complete len:283 (+) Transcript_1729:198-1046(+)